MYVCVCARMSEGRCNYWTRISWIYFQQYKWYLKEISAHVPMQVLKIELKATAIATTTITNQRINVIQCRLPIQRRINQSNMCTRWKSHAHTYTDNLLTHSLARSLVPINNYSYVNMSIRCTDARKQITVSQGCEIQCPFVLGAT